MTERREWIVNEEKMALTDSPQSLVIDQAANREWSAQAVLREILRGM